MYLFYYVLERSAAVSVPGRLRDARLSAGQIADCGPQQVSLQSLQALCMSTQQSSKSSK